MSALYYHIESIIILKVMNSTIYFSYFVNIRTILIVLVNAHRGSLKLGAVTDYHKLYVNGLYLKEWTEDTPSYLDPATANAATRHRICEEISRSGVFARYGKQPFSVEEIYADAATDEPNSSSTLYRFSPRQPPTEGSNPYGKRLFEIMEFVLDGSGAKYFPTHVPEYVFICLLKQTYANTLFPFYVSKAYDAERGTLAHRYLFVANEKRSYDDVMLVDVSAEALTSSDFNIELHYVELRQRHKPVSVYWFDPVCKLNVGTSADNQLFRLCAIVLTSSYFKDRVVYPRRASLPYPSYLEEEVSFQTEAGTAKTDGRRFKELMVQCWASKDDEDMDYEIFYVSRAYTTHQVLVFVKDSATDKFYLENLFYNVSVVQEN